MTGKEKISCGSGQVVAIICIYCDLEMAIGRTKTVFGWHQLSGFGWADVAGRAVRPRAGGIAVSPGVVKCVMRDAPARFSLQDLRAEICVKAQLSWVDAD
jgi:hypothetical protein